MALVCRAKVTLTKQSKFLSKELRDYLILPFSGKQQSFRWKYALQSIRCKDRKRSLGNAKQQRQKQLNTPRSATLAWLSCRRPS